MKFIEKAEKLLVLDELLRKKNTGSAEELGEKMGVSRTQMLKHIQTLRKYGLPIAYDYHLQSYYYTCPECIVINPLIVLHFSEKKTRNGSNKNAEK